MCMLGGKFQSIRTKPLLMHTKDVKIWLIFLEIKART